MWEGGKHEKAQKMAQYVRVRLKNSGTLGGEVEVGLSSIRRQNCKPWWCMREA